MANCAPYLTRSLTVLGVDGNHVSVSETAERQEVVISIQQNDEHGRIATVRLDKDQFEALCHSQYELEIVTPGATPEAE